ncbi:MAG: lipopolysaccharide heptosyltransferase II [Candidatus Solibacter usitatus]|nr:lipopolysaccharide heptosyltransferase II [Candidatus Solibacter usitatus]
MLPNLQRILVRATNWVGDAVMSLPALRAIRTHYPQAHISVLALDWVADLYGRESFADEVIPYTARRGAGDWSGKWRLACDLRRRKFDGAILLQNAFEAALVVWMAGIPIRAGYARDGRGMLLTHGVAVPRKGSIPRHQSFYYLEMLRQLGVVDRLPEEAFIRLEGVQAKHDAANPVIGVSPGAAYGSAKRWLPERFAAAAVSIAKQRGCAVALFGAESEREICDMVARDVEKAGVEAVNFAGRTSLREFIEQTASCALMLTNDSGAMHIASALGVPTVTVFGATDHIATGPTGPLARIIREPIDCSPCLKRECPLGHHRCMELISSDRVAATALELLK